MYDYRTLYETGLSQLADCFNLAFSDYEQPICFTPDSLQYYLTASAVDLSLSYGAFRDGPLVALLLNSVGFYQGRQVVFDAGTGVVPEHRGKQVFSALFDFASQQLRHRGIEKYYLEVLQSNHHAISVYRKKGFSVTREFSVLTASGSSRSQNSQIKMTAYPDFRPFPTQYFVEPSFEHTSYNVDRNPRLYEVLCLPDQAYCIYAKRNGEIIQLHYNTTDGLKNVLSALTDRHPSAMAKNIDCRCKDVLQALKDVGFAEILKQYEMMKDLL